MRTLSKLFWSFTPEQHAQSSHKMALKVIRILGKIPNAMCQK